MSNSIHGDAPGVEVDRADGPRAVLHRYEVVADVLVRRRFTDRRPFIDGEVTLIDVLLNEDEAGRYLGVVRGFTVRERDLARLGHAAASRDVTVDLDLVLAIGRDLRVGPHARPPLRLATLDGQRVGRSPPRRH